MTPARPPAVPEERTDLAWQRTGLGILAVAGLLAHRAVVAGRSAFLVAAGVQAVLGLLVLGVLGPLRYRRLGAVLTDGGAAPRAVAAVTAIVVVVGAVAAVAVIAP